MITTFFQTPGKLRSRRRATVFLICVLTAGGALSGCSGGEPYAAKVDDHTISAKQFEADLKAILAVPELAKGIDQQLGGSEGEGLQPGGKNTINTQFVSTYLASEIGNKMVHRYAKKHNVQPTAQDEELASNGIATSPTYLKLPKSFRERMVANDAERTAATRKYFQQNVSRYEQVCARHILVQNEENAKAIVARIRAGEDFAAIAKTDSIDKGANGGSAANGGTLPCLSPNAVVEGFANALRTLPIGAISDPVQTQFGYHIIQVQSKKTPTFEELQSSSDQTQSISADLIGELAKHAKLKINPRYGQLVTQDTPNGYAFDIRPPASKALREGSAKGAPTQSGEMSSLLQQYQSQQGESGAGGGGGRGGGGATTPETSPQGATTPLSSAAPPPSSVAQTPAQ